MNVLMYEYMNVCMHVVDGVFVCWSTISCIKILKFNLRPGMFYEIGATQRDPTPRNHV